MPRAQNLNALHVVAEVDPDQLIAALEELYGGLLHRRAFVESEGTGARLADPMRARGWLVQRDVYMALRRPPDRAPAPRLARETDAATLTAVDAATVREERWGADEDVVRQVLGARALLGRAVPAARWFVSGENGVDASMTTLYSDGATAQLENVATLREHRGRGLARAALSMAADAAVAMGHALVFIVADADDWPQRLYERLGFDPVGVSWNVVRPGPEHPAHRQPASIRRPPA